MCYFVHLLEEEEEEEGEIIEKMKVDTSGIFVLPGGEKENVVVVLSFTFPVNTAAPPPPKKENRYVSGAGRLYFRAVCVWQGW